MRVSAFLHICCLLSAVWIASAQTAGYREEVEKWRADYEADLRQDNGWLSLAGLFWLKEGNNTFGTGSGNNIVLPPGSAPEVAGAFFFHNGETQLHPSPSTRILLNGAPLHATAPLEPDTSGKPDRITLGWLSMIVIHRGARYGIRLWDNHNPARSNFGGTHWFPIRESNRVIAQFTPYPQPKMIPILNILGDTEPTPSPGFATFEWKGKPCNLEPVSEDNVLFFIFKDATSGKETYPAGRFLYAALPRDGKVVLDFNEAQNPPCAFTPYATCPLPPKQNHLPVAIEAGELAPDHAKK